jgi:hypothetical protein
MESAFHEGADSFNYQVSFPTGGKRLSKGLAENMKAKPNANTRTLSPPQVLGRVIIVPGLRPVGPRNTGASAATTKEGLRPFDHCIDKGPDCYHTFAMNKAQSMQKEIKCLYRRFFSKLGVDRKNGNVIHHRKWSDLRFPIYPYIGRAYGTQKSARVLFIGLQLGTDHRTDIIGFHELRDFMEKHGERLFPHNRGMAVATIRFLSKPSKQLNDTFKDKTYKETCEAAKEIRPNFTPVYHFALTNFYKFVTKRKRNAKFAANDGTHVDTELELQLLRDEIQILRPKFLVFEGAHLKKLFKKEPWSIFIAKIKKQNKNVSVYFSHHPAARDLHQNTSKYLKSFEPPLMS